MSMRARIVLCSVGLAALPGRGHAQSASVQAQSVFDEGRRLLKAGKTAEACAAFEASQKLDPVITTQLNIATCREQNRQLASAWGAFVEAQRMARAAGNDKLLKVATGHARKLEPRLSRLTISVPADRQVAGLVVTRGKDAVDPVSWNHALPIDGGSYTIAARAPGREPWSTTRTIKTEGESVTIEIPRLAESAAPVAAAPPAAPAPAPAPAVPPARVATAPASTPPAAHDAPAPRGAPDSDDRVGASRMLPLALGGGAVVLAGAALGFDLWGDKFYDRAKTATTQRERDQQYHSANVRRYTAEGLAVAALGCGGAAVYLYLRGRNETRPATAIAPLVAPSLTGVAVLGRW